MGTVALASTTLSIMMKIWLMFLGLSCLSAIDCQEKSANGQQDVLDTVAWAANWIASVGLYAARQDRPYNRPSDDILEDLPKIYIPNELTGNEIVRALKLTGKDQMLTENNEMLKFLDFHMRRKEDMDDVQDVNGTNSDDISFSTGFNPTASDDISTYFEEDTTGEYFVLSESYIQLYKEILAQYSLNEDIIETVGEMLSMIRYKKEQETWDTMIKEANSQYQKMMRLLEEKNIAEMTEEGLYAITKSGSNLVHGLVNSTVLENYIRRVFPGKDTNYNHYKGHIDFLNKVDGMVKASSSILRLPSELSWENIKYALQTMYKKAIPQVHLYQFLTHSLDYLEIDSNVKGMSKLSDFVTQHLVDALWDVFGCLYPLGKCYQERIEEIKAAQAMRIREQECRRQCEEPRFIQLDTEQPTILTSPAYPLDYCDGLDCIWTITAPASTMIMLEFSDFQLEDDSSCSYDYVLVYDGATTSNDTLGSKACGISGGGPHVSTSDTMTIKFHTDGSTEKKGFQAVLTTI